MDVHGPRRSKSNIMFYITFFYFYIRFSDLSSSTSKRPKYAHLIPQRISHCWYSNCPIVPISGLNVIIVHLSLSEQVHVSKQIKLVDILCIHLLLLHTPISSILAWRTQKEKPLIFTHNEPNKHQNIMADRGFSQMFKHRQAILEICKQYFNIQAYKHEM